MRDPCWSHQNASNGKSFSEGLKLESVAGDEWALVAAQLGEKDSHPEESYALVEVRREVESWLGKMDQVIVKEHYIDDKTEGETKSVSRIRLARILRELQAKEWFWWFWHLSSEISQCYRYSSAQDGTTLLKEAASCSMHASEYDTIKFKGMP